MNSIYRWITLFVENLLVIFCHFALQEETVLRKLEDVRLLESRKSARLVNSDTDFSKLADVNISSNGGESRERMDSGKKRGTKSNAIEVPRSDYVQIAG